MNLIDVNNFDAMRIGLASPEQIRAWSFGEVKKPETINYRTLKPERDGLFCEKIFGPTKDWECHCGKYKRIRFKGMICDRCGVEITRAKVRRERMGHIELATPVSHIWYLKGVPSRIGILLDMSPRQLEKVIYFAAYVVIDAGDTTLGKREVLSEQKYREARDKFGQKFKAGMGAEAIRELLRDLNLKKIQEELRSEFKVASGQKKLKAIKRLEVVEAFLVQRQQAGVDGSGCRSGDRARTAPDGAARRRPLRHVGPQRSLSPRHQPQQPLEASAGVERARDHHQERKAHAARSSRRADRQRPSRPSGDGPEQSPAQIALGHSEG